MGGRKLKHRASLFVARDEIMETHDQCKAHPLTQAHVATCADQIVRWSAVFAQELALRDSVGAAKARVFWATRALHNAAGRVSKAIFAITSDTSEDRRQPLYIAYFGDKTLGEFKRSPIEERIEAMGRWVEQLAESGAPALVGLGPEVTAAVNGLKNARSALGSREQQLRYFREAGDRKKFFDHLNAERKEMYGEIAKLPFLHPGLPSNFASFFFLRGPEKKEKAPTVETVQDTIARLERQVAAQKELLADLEAGVVDEEKKAAEIKAKGALAEQLEREAAEAELQAKAKRAKIAALGI